MLINPVSFRLSVSLFWNSTWSLYNHKKNQYKYLFYSDIVFFEFFFFFFQKIFMSLKYDNALSHLRLYRVKDIIILNVYYHCADDLAYFDSLDKFYQSSQKHIKLTKKKKKNIQIKKKNNYEKELENLKKLKFEKIKLLLKKKINKFFQSIENRILIYIVDLILKQKESMSYLFSSLEEEKNKLFHNNSNIFSKNLLNRFYLNFNIIHDIEVQNLTKDFLRKYSLKQVKYYLKFFLNNFNSIKELTEFQEMNHLKNKKKILFLNKLHVLKHKRLKDKNFNKFFTFFFKKKVKEIKDKKKKEKEDLLLKLGKYNEELLSYNLDYIIPNDVLKLSEIINQYYIDYDYEVFYKQQRYLIAGVVEYKFYGKFLEKKLLEKYENMKIKKKQVTKKKNLKINKLKRKLKKLKKNFFPKSSLKKKKKIKRINKIRSFLKKYRKYFKKGKKKKKKGKNIQKLKDKKKKEKKKNIQNKLLQIKKKIKNKHTIKKSNLWYLYQINFLKYIYMQKFWIFNIYYYFLGKFLQNESQNIFLKALKKLQLNIFKITIFSIRATIISEYINASFKHRYSIYETMRPILVDLKQRMRIKKVAGFKIIVSGRFKRAQRATFWWRKTGLLSTGTPTSDVDYSTSLHKTKYGVCTISVWLTPGYEGLGKFEYEYPKITPFFFSCKENKLLKIKYFLIKKNIYFFEHISKSGEKLEFEVTKNYNKGLIIGLLSKYLYINIFLKHLNINTKFGSKINKNLKRIFLPQYCIYKLYLEEILKQNCIKILPFIQIKLLKRINLRNAYKINFANTSKLINLDIFKYKIYLN